MIDDHSPAAAADAFAASIAAGAAKVSPSWSDPDPADRRISTSTVASKRSSRRKSMSPTVTVYTFRWIHRQKQVFLTGSFDNWTCSVVMQPSTKDCEEFEATLIVDRSVDFEFKFVADGVWRCGPYPTKTDDKGNVNNVLPSLIIPPPMRRAHSTASITDYSLPTPQRSPTDLSSTWSEYPWNTSATSSSSSS